MPSTQLRHDHVLRGIMLRILAMLSFATMAALLKFAAERGVSAPEMIFYRAALGFPVIFLWVLSGPGMSSLRTKRPRAHLWRSIIGLASMLLTFEALVLLPLAEATTLNFTAPVFATILSWLVLRETVGWHRWAAVGVGFLGVLIVLRPGHSVESLPLIGVVIALMAAFGQAGVAITLRQLGDSEHVAATVFWFTVAGTLVGLVLLVFFGKTHDAVTYALLFAAATFGTVAQFFMTGSLRHAPVSVVMPFDYLQLFAAMLFGWLMFSTVPTLSTLAGAALIIGSGLYTVVRERQRHLPRAGSVTPGVGGQS